jgi:hypothetical protein
VSYVVEQISCEPSTDKRVAVSIDGASEIVCAVPQVWPITSNDFTTILASYDNSVTSVVVKVLGVSSTFSVLLRTMVIWR